MGLLLARRALIAGGGLAALLASQRAEANTPFASFAFRATGAPTSRTMSARLAEIKNVKDFGAVGNGIADDTVAIQAAADWTSGANRGTIYFPLGTYNITAPITFNYDGDLSIRFLGEYGSVVSGTFNGYLFDRSLATPNNTIGGRIFEKLFLINGHNTGGCIRVGSSIGAAIRDCSLSSHTNITTEDAVGVSSQNTLIQSCSFSQRGTVSGSHHIIIGGGGSIQGCNIKQSDTGVRAYGSGLQMAGNRSERCNTAVLLGLDSGDNNVGLSGFALTSGSWEGNWTCVDFVGTCSGFVVSGYSIIGHNSANAGVTPGIQASQYGIRIRADGAQNGVINGVSVGSQHEVACIAIANATSRANLRFVGVTALQTGGAGVSWLMPTNAQTASFSNCNTTPLWTFSQLPTGGNLLEGDEFDITDSNTATWGATVAGGGSNRALVRYNGTNWTVVGI